LDGFSGAAQKDLKAQQRVNICRRVPGLSDHLQLAVEFGPERLKLESEAARGLEVGVEDERAVVRCKRRPDTQQTVWEQLLPIHGEKPAIEPRGLEVGVIHDRCIK
jgi:hypothetical protein